MYNKFYGLKEKPFEITTDPRFLYLSEGHKEALAHLIYAVQGKKGFAVITGEVGTGKSTLVQSLLSRMNGSTRTAYLFNPKLDSNSEFLQSVCDDLEIKIDKGTKADYLIRLNDYLMECYCRNENVVLIIDEAQTLSPQLLEEVRLLTNLETPNSKLLQVILVGQPELDDTLAQPRFRALKQRISVRYCLQPLSRKEMEEYIRRRLRVAGAKNTDVFSSGALKTIFEYSRGIPRLINIVCDNALVSGYVAEKGFIQEKMIREVVSDLEGRGRAGNRKRISLRVAVAAGIVGALLLLFFLGRPQGIWDAVGRLW